MSEMQASSPGIFRRIACLVYESLLLLAVLMVATGGFLLFVPDATSGLPRLQLQLFLWSLTGIYLIWQWRRGGQTLAMKTWRIRVVTHAGQPLSFKQSLRRYLLASLFFGVSFLWAFFDRDKLYLHDRLNGSRLLLTPVASELAR